MEVVVKDLETCETMPGTKVTTTLSDGTPDIKYSNHYGNVKFHDCQSTNCIKSKLTAEKFEYCPVNEEVRFSEITVANKKEIFMRKHQSKTFYSSVCNDLIITHVFQMLQWLLEIKTIVRLVTLLS